MCTTFAVWMPKKMYKIYVSYFKKVSPTLLI